MNHYLKTIQDLFQQGKNLSEADKEALLKAIADADKQWSITDFKLDRTEKVKKTTAILLEETIEELEHKRKAVETQNRELEIESSLERVRTVAMGMKVPADMLDICRIMSEQLESLGIKEIRNVQTAIFYEDKGTYMNYEYYRLHDRALVTEVGYTSNKMTAAFAARMMKGAGEFFTENLKGKALKGWFEFQKTTPQFADSYLAEASSLNYYWYSLGPIALGMSTYAPLGEEEIKLFNRFRNVFDLAYRRFLDIEKAEAQAKEAKIEAALERTRTQSMIMQHSKELDDTLRVFHEQVLLLGINSAFSFLWLPDEEKDRHIFWAAWGEDKNGSTVFKSKAINYPLDRNEPATAQCLVDWKSNEPIYSYHVPPAAVENYFAAWQELIDGVEQLKPEYFSDGLYYVEVFMKYGCFGVMVATDLTEDEKKILGRFTIEFERTYTRFLDLQKAEAQAREAQIELALERVRARTMAMQKSDELAETASLLFKQINDLGIQTWTSGFNIWEGNDTSFIGYNPTPSGDIAAPYHIPSTEDSFFINIYEAKKRGEDFFVFESAGESLAETYNYMKTLPVVKDVLKGIEDSGFQLPSFQINHCAFFSQGFLLFITLDVYPEAHDIFKRFAKVFEQTYTRFLDLQKAEAQARESQIQLALERVRARTMAMQKSDELPEAANLLFQQIQSLGMPAWSAGYCIWDEDKKGITLWMSSEGVLQPPFKAPLTEDTSFIHMREAHQRGETFYVDEIGGEELVRHYEYMRTLPVVGEILDSIIEAGHPLPTFQIFHLAYFSKGFLLFITYESVPAAHDIFKRFGKVFEQTYTRFLDLQKAEAQARESQIQLALERVRARTMAMQKSEELPETAYILFQQFKDLGEDPIQITIGIFNEDEKQIKFSITGLDGSGSKIDESFNMDIGEPNLLHKIYKAWKEQKRSLVLELKGKELLAWIAYRNKVARKYNMSTTKINADDCRLVSAAFFSKGFISFSKSESIPRETMQILERFAGVFDGTYTRFLDLQKAEAQVREAKIEAALERVRSRTMGMQHSEELAETASLLFTQISDLGIKVWSSGFQIWNTDDISTTAWMNTAGGEIQAGLRLPHTEDPFFKNIYNARHNADGFFVMESKGKELEETYRYMFGIPEWKTAFGDIEASGFTIPTFQITHCVFFPQGYLMFITYEPYPEFWDIFKRFGKVFEQTYTRFLDLQKAETQAREAQIELALERVRAKAMAMHHSDELSEVLSVLFDQFDILGICPSHTTISLIDLEKNSFTFRMTGKAGKRVMAEQVISLDALNMWNDTVDQLKNFSDVRVYCNEYPKTVLPKLWELCSEVIAAIPEDARPYPEDFPDGMYEAVGIYRLSGGSTYGTISFCHNRKATEEEKDIVGRFATEFGRLYQRFLDLQKAEAQARESQIQLAMERVRARTMAMQKSDELPEAANLLFQQVQTLGMPAWSAGYCIWDEDKKAITLSMSSEGVLQPSLRMPLTEDPSLMHFLEAHQRGETFFVEEVGGEALKTHYTYLRTLPGVKETLDDIEKAGFPVPTFQIFHCAYFSKGFLLFITYEPVPEAHDIFKRFGKVFEQTYTRFNDLKQAEAQARESQIEAALERVRSRTMAMQQSNELKDAALLLFQQVQTFGVDQWACGYNIWEADGETCTAWMSRQGALQPPFKTHPAVDSCFQRFYEAKQRGESFYVEEMGGDELITHYKRLISLPEFELAPQEFFDEFIAPKFQIFHIAYFEQGYLMFITYERVPEMYDVFKRFAKIFEQTYTRFLDLQKAEAQARESQIQLALERVRAKTMAMQHSDELKEAAALLFQQAKALGVPAYSCGYNIWENNETVFTSWMGTQDGSDFNAVINIPLTEDANFIRFAESRQKGEEFFVLDLRAERMQEHYRYLKTIPAFKAYFDYTEHAGIPAPEIQIHHIANFSHGNLLFITLEPCPEFHKVFKRFAAVFDQTYTRFLDLQKAEAQAREARIEAALERVRSRTMAMQKSDELTDVAGLLFTQVSALGIKTWTAGFNVWSEDNNSYVDYITSPNGGFIEPYTVYTDTAEALTDISNARKSGVEFDVQYVEGEKIKQLYLALTGLGEKQFEIMLQDGVRFPSHQYEHFVFGSKVSLMFITYEPVPEAHDIFKRLGKVFEQTYTRFLDLQKAEAQAMEAQIELGLERVRARAMAMQKSDELKELIGTVFTELTKLDLVLTRCLIMIYDPKTNGSTWWMANSEAPTEPVGLYIKYHELPTYLAYLKAWREKKLKWQYILEGTAKKEWDDFLFVETELSHLPDSVIAGMKAPDRVYLNASFNTFGNLTLATLEPLSDEHSDILLRFAKVFDLTYTRFNDLKQAEAQAREAQIEAALERVRGKAMAMHNSQDLTATIGVFYHELQTFSITPRRCGVGLLNKETRIAELSTMNTTEQGDSIEIIGTIKMQGHPVLEGVYDNWLLQKEYHPVLRGNEIKEYYRLLRPQIAFPDYPNDAVQFGYFFFFNEGGVYAWTEKEMNEDELQIYRRFTTVLSLTYKRYIDLKQAEANEKEAVKQAALDRIRADIASMRTTNDLERITPLVWNELTILGVPFIRSGVFIMDDEHELIHTFLSTPDGKAIGAFHIPYNTPGNIAQVLRHWHNKKNYIDHWDEKAFTEFANTLVKQGALASTEQYLKTIPHGGFYLHFLPFLQGMLYVGNSTQLDEEEIKLIQSVADAFSTAYARYEDFNKLEAAKKQVDSTLNELQATQKQLIQSEKMASLGELTAGIAHEIQNPLNFVNNFSEVSTELLDEMITELENDNKEDAKAIADDVKQNLEKILHHGKRADGIVKGMLQHSRSSSAVKEPTDINKLADEYLRLAYHGLRAKDKSFNATLKTDYDETIGNINITPQDIGRAVLNLINNAFYAASLPSKGGFPDSDNSKIPTVWVSTKKEGNKVLIRVKDNGPGIPKNTLDKIFQPFFTTKPTGQGTGLGLSLSYDIVKAHGGELRVETKEAEGSEFIIQIPAA
jgi:signal transduction histidine kinase/DNA-directed RNA polymerase subunit N (RpoN/RPB10)